MLAGMPTPDDLEPRIDAHTPQGLARAFLWLGVAALIGAGLLALVLVLARTPGLATALPALATLFRAALIVHVDLSVLIWFMAFAGVLWSLVTPGLWLALGWFGWWAAAAGTVVLTLSPFLPGAEPLLNNYIPVLEQRWFFAGLALAGLGFGATMLRTLGLALPRWRRLGPLEQGIVFGAAAGALAWLALAWNLGQPLPESGAARYEVLFWAPGHVLQFQHTLLAAAAWLWLLCALEAPPPWSTRVVRAAFVLAALPLVWVPVPYLLHPVASSGLMTGFARLMEWGHLAMLPLMLAVALALPRVLRGSASAAKGSLLASLLLFGTGGVLAFMIRGANVVVPAHYHGSIVGVTLAFMGLAYVLLPRLGFRAPAGRMALWQPYVYGGGQLMHILGLAWSGGYGVQRKVAGAEQVLLGAPERIGMGMMGLGGLVAVIGGVMFVLVCLRAMWPREGLSA